MNLCRYLRGPDGCPWDREQTSTDFARHSIGETEELLEALQGTDNAHAEEEFGDTLFVMLAAGAAAEAEGRFNVQRALERAHEKMIRRHDHVFGENKAATPEDAIAAWNRIKQQERENA
jgi:tetrapyrrole methylase family protein/MazG family protein